MTDEETIEGKIEDQPAPVTPPVADQPATSDVVDDDPDAKELADAMAEVEAEDKAAKGEPDDKPKADEGATAPPPATAPTDKPKADAGTPASPMIPKERLDQTIDRLKRAESEAQYYKGLAEAAKATSTRADAKTPKPKPEDQIADLEAQIEAAWKKVDSYEVAPSEARAQEREMQKQIDALKAPTPEPAKPDPGPREDLYLREKTEAIMQAHPYVSKIDALPDANERWDFIEGEAARQMAAAGTPLNTADPMSVLHFRQGVAKLADTYGPLWAGPLDQTQSPTPTKPTNGSTPSELAKAREAKLTMADTMPPDLSKVGSGGGGELQVTDAQIEAMSDEDIEKLPEAVRKRIAGDSF
jgi:hypothetical protein